MAKVAFIPSRFIVTVSALSAATGAVVPVIQHECRDRLHGVQLLTELRDLAAELAETGLLPGLSVAGYEVQEAVSVPEVELPPVPATGRDAQWWAQAIGLKVPAE